ncbi:MAG: gluconate 2-dehydrogenase subunit 3 family protein [Acidobacteriaceae bacterium]
MVEEKQIADHKLRFQRRSLLKMMMAAPVVGLAPMASLAAELAKAMPVQVGGGNASGEGPDAYRPRVFGPQEWKTVRALSDCILPADDSSGSACDAGVPEFLDDWLDYQRGDLLTEVHYGLAWLDAEAQRRFQRAFAECLPEQQTQILDRIAWPQKATPEDAHAVAFFSSLRNLVLGGYFTSEMGIRNLPYIGNEPQTGWEGCPAPVLAKLGLA